MNIAATKLAQPAPRPWNTRAERIALTIYPLPGLPREPLPRVMDAIERLAKQPGGYERLEKLSRENRPELIRLVQAELRR